MDDAAENPLAHENVVTSGLSPPNGSTYIPNHPSFLGPGPCLRPPSGRSRSILYPQARVHLKPLWVRTLFQRQLHWLI